MVWRRCWKFCPIFQEQLPFICLETKIVLFLKVWVESLTSFLCTLVTRLSECSGFEFWSATFHEFFEFEESKQEKTGAWRKYYFDFKKFQKKYLSIFNDFKVYATIHIIKLLFFQKLSAFSSFCFAPVVFCFENIHSSKNSIGCAEPIGQRSTY